MLKLKKFSLKKYDLKYDSRTGGKFIKTNGFVQDDKIVFKNHTVALLTPQEFLNIFSNVEKDLNCVCFK